MVQSFQAAGDGYQHRVGLFCCSSRQEREGDGRKTGLRRSGGDPDPSQEDREGYCGQTLG